MHSIVPLALLSAVSAIIILPPQVANASNSTVSIWADGNIANAEYTTFPTTELGDMVIHEAAPDSTTTTDSTATTDSASNTDSASSTDSATSTNSESLLVASTSSSTIEPPASTSEVANLDDCQDIPDDNLGHGPVPNPDTPTDFLRNEEIANASKQAVTPAGFHRTYQNKHACMQDYPALGRKMIGSPLLLTSYDPQKCATMCTARSDPNAEITCEGFNIFYERRPKKNPAEDCPNPDSTTVIQCTFWNIPPTAEFATNEGQTMRFEGKGKVGFSWKIAGSNGYAVGNGSGALSLSTVSRIAVLLAFIALIADSL